MFKHTYFLLLLGEKKTFKFYYLCICTSHQQGMSTQSISYHSSNVFPRLFSPSIFNDTMKTKTNLLTHTNNLHILHLLWQNTFSKLFYLHIYYRICSFQWQLICFEMCQVDISYKNNNIPCQDMYVEWSR